MQGRAGTPPMHQNAATTTTAQSLAGSDGRGQCHESLVCGLGLLGVVCCEQRHLQIGVAREGRQESLELGWVCRSNHLRKCQVHSCEIIPVSHKAWCVQCSLNRSQVRIHCIIDEVLVHCQGNLKSLVNALCHHLGVFRRSGGKVLGDLWALDPIQLLHDWVGGLGERLGSASHWAIWHIALSPCCLCHNWCLGAIDAGVTDCAGQGLERVIRLLCLEGIVACKELALQLPALWECGTQGSELLLVSRSNHASKGLIDCGEVLLGCHKLWVRHSAVQSFGMGLNSRPHQLGVHSEANLEQLFHCLSCLTGVASTCICDVLGNC
mmetsp:Transcript_61240/g.113689  ORF Transcript_61240/g.113689 Transcript_61240/m.113689 type:complete len:323 (-) Transcript_61240:317-1285(-)